MVGNGTTAGRGPRRRGEHAVRAPVSRGCMNSNEVRPPTVAGVNVNPTFYLLYYVIFLHKQLVSRYIVTKHLSSDTKWKSRACDATSSCDVTFAIIALVRYDTLLSNSATA